MQRSALPLKWWHASKHFHSRADTERKRGAVVVVEYSGHNRAGTWCSRRRRKFIYCYIGKMKWYPLTPEKLLIDPFNVLFLITTTDKNYLQCLCIIVHPSSYISHYWHTNSQSTRKGYICAREKKQGFYVYAVLSPSLSHVQWWGKGFSRFGGVQAVEFVVLLSTSGCAECGGVRKPNVSQLIKPVDSVITELLKETASVLFSPWEVCPLRVTSGSLVKPQHV